MSQIIREIIEPGKVKAEYIAQGGNPRDVFSPERMDVFLNGGPDALYAEPPLRRKDGSIAAPYMPVQQAMALGLIEEKALPAVREAIRQGVHTVSSGFDPDKGVGFAIGRAPDGRVVRIEQ